MARTRTTTRTKAKTKTAGLNLSKMALKDLLSLQSEVERAISIARQRERTEVLQKMEKIAHNAGFSLPELVGGRGKGKGKITVAKYANPENRAETWTGRGRKPNWLVSKLKKGSKLEDFAI